MNTSSPNPFYYSPVADSDPNNGSDSSRWILNGFEWLIIILSLLILIGVTIFGFISQESKNHDSQKDFDITQLIIPALDDFYKNTGAVESSRFYPVARCSGDLNEVDYEFTLRQNLVGKIPEVDNHAYIQPNNYPVDKQGVYSDNFADRKTTYRCPEKLNFSTNSSNKRIYEDHSSCNFKQSTNLKNCYLYTSSAVGDSYQVAYHSETKNCFIVFSKFRNQNLNQVSQCT